MASTVSEAFAQALAKSEELPPEALDVPTEVMAWVEREYDLWLQNPDAWRHITLPTEEEIESLKRDANKYLRYGRKAGRLTLQTKTGYPRKVKGGWRLAYKVRNPISRNSAQ